MYNGLTASALAATPPQPKTVSWRSRLTSKDRHSKVDSTGGSCCSTSRPSTIEHTEPEPGSIGSRGIFFDNRAGNDSEEDDHHETEVDNVLKKLDQLVEMASSAAGNNHPHRTRVGSSIGCSNCPSAPGSATSSEAQNGRDDGKDFEDEPKSQATEKTLRRDPQAFRRPGRPASIEVVHNLEKLLSRFGVSDPRGSAASSNAAVPDNCDTSGEELDEGGGHRAGFTSAGLSVTSAGLSVTSTSQAESIPPWAASEYDSLAPRMHEQDAKIMRLHAELLQQGRQMEKVSQSHCSKSDLDTVRRHLEDQEAEIVGLKEQLEQRDHPSLSALERSCASLEERDREVAELRRAMESIREKNRGLVAWNAELGTRAGEAEAHAEAAAARASVASILAMEARSELQHARLMADYANKAVLVHEHIARLEREHKASSGGGQCSAPTFSAMSDAWSHSVMTVAQPSPVQSLQSSPVQSPRPQHSPRQPSPRPQHSPRSPRMCPAHRDGGGQALSPPVQHQRPPMSLTVGSHHKFALSQVMAASQPLIVPPPHAAAHRGSSPNAHAGTYSRSPPYAFTHPFSPQIPSCVQKEARSPRLSPRPRRERHVSNPGLVTTLQKPFHSSMPGSATGTFCGGHGSYPALHVNTARATNR